MFWINTKRIVRAGFVNFWRNRFVSLAAVLAMTLALLVISTILFLSAIFNFTLVQVKDKVDISVYFVTSAAEEDILSIKKSLESLPEVMAVTYISREQALADFRNKHTNDDEILQALNELPDNPLEAALNIKAKDPSQYEGITNFLKSNDVLSKDSTPIIRKINFEENQLAIDRLNKIIALANKFGFGLAVAFILISIIITLNTIRLVIYISKDEISVMRLVGASSKYVKGPFIISGLIYGVVSTALVLLILFPITYWLSSVTGRFFAGLDLFAFYLNSKNFLEIAGILLGSGLLVGAVSSFLAVRRYLKH
jgi:cell division transport system permease protein